MQLQMETVEKRRDTLERTVADEPLRQVNTGVVCMCVHNKKRERKEKEQIRGTKYSVAHEND